ncbi:class D sortase [Clostridium sp. DL1XJH146]
MRKKWSIFIIITGIFILLLPLISKKITDLKQYEILNQMESDINQEPEMAIALKNSENSKATNTTSTNISENSIIEIEKISLKMPLLEGVTKENLNLSASHDSYSSPPGEKGNCIILGHRSYTYGRHFNRLNELSIGDEIKITSENQEFTYTVIEKIIVLPEDIDANLKTTNSKLLTLITCHPVRIATHRLMIIAELIQ